MSKNREEILQGKTILGIELGSTRIKGVLINTKHEPVASGSFSWENRLENGIWTYHKEDVWNGIRQCYAKLRSDVREKYDVELRELRAIGISGMMHGYLALDKRGEWLAPFYTWRNMTTEQAAEELTDLFQYHIPQRWSIAHLRQAILNGEEHVRDIDCLTTLAGYVHMCLTGHRVLGIGEASGMFPIDTKTKDYDSTMLEKFDQLIGKEQLGWNTKDILPKVLTAGEPAGVLTEDGAKLLDPSGNLCAGIPLCPPEGDAGTGMTATNSVAKCTGNVSAGTSIFLMAVLEEELKKVHRELDLVTTPAGELTAMVHCNNCTSDLNAWMSLFQEFLRLMGHETDLDELYSTLFGEALKGAKDGGGLLSYCYLSGEHITGSEEGRPLFIRKPESRFNLADFMRTNLMTTFGAIRIGLEILWKEEGIRLNKIYGHGGLFKTPQVAQQLLAAAVKAPVSVMKTAGEGGAWGIALLAAYMSKKSAGQKLEDYLNTCVFEKQNDNTVVPEEEAIQGFDRFMENYKSGLAIEKEAIRSFV